MKTPSLYSPATWILGLSFCWAACGSIVPVQAAFELQVDLAGWQSDAAFPGAAGNTLQMFNLPANAQILAVEYAIDFTSNSPSNRDEFVISLNNSNFTDFWDWRPASTLGTPGNFTGSGSFGNPGDPSGGPFSLLADGMLVVTVYEDQFADPDAMPDAVVNSGSLRISYVPEPGCGLFLAACSAGLILVRRRRS